MTYGSILFLSNKKHLKKIQKMLNDSIRFVARKRIVEKVNMRELSKELNIPILKKIYLSQTLMEMIKMDQKRNMYFVKVNERTKDFKNEKLRTYGRKHLAKKSCIAKMLTL